MMAASPGPEGLAAFERRQRARRTVFQILAAVAGLIPLTLGIVSFAMRVESCSRSPPPPGIEVDIDPAGRTTVRDCRDDFEICVRGAAERERNRAGGGRYRALVRVAGGAPREAVRDARSILMANEFVPANP